MTSINSNYTKHAQMVKGDLMFDQDYEKPLLESIKSEVRTELDIENQSTFFKCLVKVVGLSLAVLLYGSLHPLFFLIATIFCAKLGTIELAGFGLGSLTVGIVGMAVSLSFNSGLITFCSAAAGMKDYRACVIYRNRVMFLDTLVWAFMGIPMLFIEEIYVALGQDPNVTPYAVMYVNIVYPSILFYTWFQAITFYSSTIQRFDVPSIATFLASLIQLGLTIVLVNNLQWGFEGICWGIFWNFTSRFVISIPLLLFSNHPVVNPKVIFISEETIKNLKPLFIICISACSMAVWTAWAFDSLVLMSTWLSAEMTAAQTIMRTINMLSFTIPIAFQISCFILIGQSVGEANTTQIKRIYLTCLTLAVIFGGLSILFLHK